VTPLLALAWTVALATGTAAESTALTVRLRIGRVMSWLRSAVRSRMVEPKRLKLNSGAGSGGVTLLLRLSR